jgi:hypothetical protein
MDLYLLAADHRTRRATQAYYIIYDKPPDERRILAIHRVFESAEACFGKLMNSGDYTRVVQLWQVQTNEFGFTIKEVPLYTYSKQMNLLINHAQQTDVSGCRPPPIRVPV